MFCAFLNLSCFNVHALDFLFILSHITRMHPIVAHLAKFQSNELGVSYRRIQVAFHSDVTSNFTFRTDIIPPDFIVSASQCFVVRFVFKKYYISVIYYLLSNEHSNGSI